MAVIMGGGPRFIEWAGVLLRDIERVRLTAQENFNVLACRWHVCLDVFLCDETSTAVPVRWRIVQDIVHLEAVGISEDESIEFGSKQNVLRVDVGVDEGETGAVSRVIESCADDLEHGCDARATCNHANLATEGWGVLELALWTLHADRVTDAEE
jgi:hypothetical protein